MTAARNSFERRLLASLGQTPPRVPVVVGGCLSGRTTLLRALHHRLGGAACQYIDVERIATTPERFLRAVLRDSPFRPAEPPAPTSSSKEAFAHSLDYFDSARGAGGERATFLLDEVLEVRTFESFPGLRYALDQMLGRLAASGNRFILTTRYATRAAKLLARLPDTLTLVHLAPVGPDEVREMVSASLPEGGTMAPEWSEDTSRLIATLADGRAGYARALAEATAGQAAAFGEGDAISGLSSEMAPGGRLASACAHSYELRLHRARGYGALKAILDVLAEAEPRTLSQIASELGRTAGSTRDYLAWLEDVDLVSLNRKRFRFSDPVLRLWVRLYSRPTPPSDEEVARESRAYALGRLAGAESAEPPPA